MNGRTLPKIADDDMEAVFYALDDSGDFKVFSKAHSFVYPSLPDFDSKALIFFILLKEVKFDL